MYRVFLNILASVLLEIQYDHIETKCEMFGRAWFTHRGSSRLEERGGDGVGVGKKVEIAQKLCQNSKRLKHLGDISWGC